jgi:hypothetical protein
LILRESPYYNLGNQMTHDRADVFEWAQESELSAPQSHRGAAILAELCAVLGAYPDGLRRWSVMRAMRKERECRGQDVAPNFEAEVERTFRQFCADATAKRSSGAAKDVVFFRPPEKAGEVWAIIRDRGPSARTDG